jgi:hypothetical protein
VIERQIGGEMNQIGLRHQISPDSRKDAPVLFCLKGLRSRVPAARGFKQARDSLDLHIGNKVGDVDIFHGESAVDLLNL